MLPSSNPAQSACQSGRAGKRLLPGPTLKLLSQSRHLHRNGAAEHRSGRHSRCIPTLVPRADQVDRAQQSIAKPQVSTSRRVLSLGCCCCGWLVPKTPKEERSTYNPAFAAAMAYGMQDYEEKIRPVKAALFAEALEGSPKPCILEVGMGTGPNLPFYAQQPGVSVIGIEPNLAMNDFTRQAAESAGMQQDQLTLKAGRAEHLPVPDASVDLAVCTLVLCSVDSVEASLKEVRRVLKPGGKLLYVEHVYAPGSKLLLRLTQQVLNPLQQLLADGCHLTRDPVPLFGAAGLHAADVKRFEMEGEGPIAPHVAGIATC